MVGILAVWRWEWRELEEFWANPAVPPDKRALFIICTSELGPQIYELVALTSSEKNT